MEVTFSIRLGPLRWVPAAHYAGRQGLILLTAVRPVELAQYESAALPTHTPRNFLVMQEQFHSHGQWWTVIVRYVKPLRAAFFRGNIKHIFTFYVIPPHWYDTGSWNPSSIRTRTYPFYMSTFYSQYRGCWCPGDAKSQDISSYDTDIVKPI